MLTQLQTPNRAFLAETNNRRRSLSNRGKSNCVGTALYLIGEQPSDAYVYNNESRGKFPLEGDHTSYFETLEETDEPVLGGLVVWKAGKNSFPANKVYHAGVIVNTDPILVAHRDGFSGPFHRNMPLEIVNEKYKDFFGEKGNITFLLPSKLIGETK